MALGAVEAIAAAGRSGRIRVVGFDALDDARKAIEAGRMEASVAQSPRDMGRLAVESAATAAARRSRSGGSEGADRAGDEVSGLPASGGRCRLNGAQRSRLEVEERVRGERRGQSDEVERGADRAGPAGARLRARPVDADSRARGWRRSRTWTQAAVDEVAREFDVPSAATPIRWTCSRQSVGRRRRHRHPDAHARAM